MYFNPFNILNLVWFTTVTRDDGNADVRTYKRRRQIIRTKRASTRRSIEMLMKQQNFHGAKKRIVVCVLFIGKYFLICKRLWEPDCNDKNYSKNPEAKRYSRNASA